MTTDTQLVPTDAEIVELMRDGYNCRYNDEADHIDFARAVLARWGQPARSGEPVAWLDPWTSTKVTTDYDAYGKHGIPLYTAPQDVKRELLTDEQIHAIYDKVARREPYAGAVTRRNIVRAIEVAHGITGGQHGTE